MNRFALILGFLLVLGLLLMGCGAAATPAPLTTSSKGTAPLPAATMVPAPAAAPDASTRSAVNESASTLKLDVTDRLIIRNGNMTIIVADVNVAVSKVSDIANEAGGFVVRTDSRHQGDNLYATVVIKVPAESFDDVMSKLRKLAVKVDAESSSTQDVTEEYVDLSARLKVYEATEQQLLTFLQKTQNVDESLKVYRELNNVRSQIESLKGRMNYLQKSAAMSNITVQIRPQEKEKPIVEEEGWDPLKTARNALRSLVNALKALLNLAIYVALWLIPILIIVGIPLLALRALWRRLRRRKAK